MSAAVLAPVDLGPFLIGPNVWNAPSQSQRLDVSLFIVEQCYTTVGNTLEPDRKDGIQASLQDEIFNERFVETINPSRHDIPYVAEQMRLVEAHLSRAATELRRLWPASASSIRSGADVDLN